MLSLRPVVVRGGKARMTSQGEFMTFRFTPKTLFGATAMLVVGAALVSAQDTSKTRPRSDRRIPISKEAPGEVVRTDTVMIYRTDTLQLTTRVVDTVRMTRTRVDTVIPRLPKFTYPKGFYGGLGGRIQHAVRFALHAEQHGWYGSAAARLAEREAGARRPVRRQRCMARTGFALLGVPGSGDVVELQPRRQAAVAIPFR